MGPDRQADGVQDTPIFGEGDGTMTTKAKRTYRTRFHRLAAPGLPGDLIHEGDAPIDAIDTPYTLAGRTYRVWRIRFAPTAQGFEADVDLVPLDK
jgi:hypothetical protein